MSKVKNLLTVYDVISSFLVSMLLCVCWSDDVTSGLRAVRYAESITIHVDMQPDQSSGLIYLPYLTVKYAVATADDYHSNKNATVVYQFSLLISFQIRKFVVWWY